MKLAFFSFNLQNRGTYLRAKAFADELVKLGHSVDLFTSTTEASLEIIMQDGVKIVCVPGCVKGKHYSGWDICEALSRVKQLKGEKYDIVHSFEMRPTCAIPSIHSKHHGSLLVSDWADWFGSGGSVEERDGIMRRMILRPMEDFCEKTLRKKANGVTTICSTLTEMAFNLGFDQHKILELPNGLNSKHLNQYNKVQSKMQKKIPLNKFVIGYVGSLFARDRLLMQKTIEKANIEDPNLLFLFIGRSRTIFELTGNFKFFSAEEAEDLSTLLSCCDIFWLPITDIPANWGRLPLKMSDYLTIGRPVVSTKVGDLWRVIEANDVGLVCQPNADAILEAILDLKSQPETRTKFELNTTALINNPAHMWAGRTQELLKFYGQL